MNARVERTGDNEDKVDVVELLDAFNQWAIDERVIRQDMDRSRFLAALRKDCNLTQGNSIHGKRYYHAIRLIENYLM